jgi:hypothetical protein
MSLEMVHTSVERDLRGSSGFGVAIATRGMHAALERALSELSAYDFDTTRSVGADRIDWSHRILTVQGRTHSVLSRIAPCGQDWSGRSNRIAHHLVVDPAERAPAGPAWMLRRFEGFESAVPVVGERSNGPRLPQGSDGARECTSWTVAGFDAGWAGLIARALVDHPSDAVYLVLPRDTDALPLVAEILALVPDEMRWMVTFSTRYLKGTSGARCQLRCVRADAPGLAAMLAEPGARRFVPSPGESAGDSPDAEAGRSGVVVRPARAAASLRVDPVLRGDSARAPSRVERTIDTMSDAGRPSAVRPFDRDGVQEPREATGGSMGWSRPGSGWTPPPNLVAYGLFGVAAVALLASLVIGVMMAFRN